jgi:hypothetical protein
MLQTGTHRFLLESGNWPTLVQTNVGQLVPFSIIGWKGYQLYFWNLRPINYEISLLKNTFNYQFTWLITTSYA